MLRSNMLVIVLCASMPLYAQHKAPKQNHSAPQKTEPTVTISKLVVQEPPKPEEKPKSYWERFSSPENLPNILLAITGIAGVIVAICTLRIIRRQTIAMEQSVEATEASVAAIQDQTKAMQESVEVAKKTMLLQFRPRISVLSSYLVTETTNGNQKMFAEFVLLNEGGSNATVTRSGFIVKVSDAGPALPEGATTSLGGFTLKPGEGRPTRIPIADEVRQQIQREIENKNQQGWAGHELVMLVGSISYKDELDFTRTTTITRGFDPHLSTFRPNESVGEYRT